MNETESSVVFVDDLSTYGVWYRLRTDGTFVRRRGEHDSGGAGCGFGQVLIVKGTNGSVKTLGAIFARDNRLWVQLGDLARAIPHAGAVVKISRRPFAADRHVIVQEETTVLLEATYRPTVSGALSGEEDIFQYAMWVLSTPERTREFIERMAALQSVPHVPANSSA